MPEIEAFKVNMSVIIKNTVTGVAARYKGMGGVVTEYHDRQDGTSYHIASGRVYIYIYMAKKSMWFHPDELQLIP